LPLAARVNDRTTASPLRLKCAFSKTIRERRLPIWHRDGFRRAANARQGYFIVRANAYTIHQT
jgi:hypothetical protein